MKTLVRLSAIAILLMGIAALGYGGDGADPDSTKPTCRRPLDLPTHSCGWTTDDIPETPIHWLYGLALEAEGIFVLLDRSGSMSQEGRLGILKQEIGRMIQEMHRLTEFDLVSFASGYTVFAGIPVKASAVNKARAIAWVQSLEASGMTAMASAGVRLVQISNQCSMRAKAIVVISDGEPNSPGCSETITAITTANFQRTPIHTIYVGDEIAGAQCLQQLAAANGGTFMQVN